MLVIDQFHFTEALSGGFSFNLSPFQKLGNFSPASLTHSTTLNTLRVSIFHFCTPSFAANTSLSHLPSPRITQQLTALSLAAISCPVLKQKWCNITHAHNYTDFLTGCKEGSVFFHCTCISGLLHKMWISVLQGVPLLFSVCLTVKGFATLICVTRNDALAETLNSSSARSLSQQPGCQFWMWVNVYGERQAALAWLSWLQARTVHLTKKKQQQQTLQEFGWFRALGMWEISTLEAALKLLNIRVRA